MTGCLIGETHDDMLERADELYARRPRERPSTTGSPPTRSARCRRLGRRGRRTAPRVRARRLRARDAPAPPAHRPRAGAADRPRARTRTRVTVRRVRDDPRRGRGTTRLETFSDGVFAIAATLLVLEFSVAAPRPRPRPRAAPPLAVVPRLRDELRHDRDHLDEPPPHGLVARAHRPDHALPQHPAAADRRVPAVPDEARRAEPPQRRRADGRARLRRDVRPHGGIYNVWWRYAAAAGV